MNMKHVRHRMTKELFDMGGTPSGKARARKEAWAQLLAFLDANLPGAPKQ